MKGGQFYGTTVEEIELLCGYMKSDQAIADYYGISVERVARVRADMPELRPGPTCYAPQREGSGLDAQHSAMLDARQGSHSLNGRIQSLFRKWEAKHGFKEGAAQILLPAGYSPERRSQVAA